MSWCFINWFLQLWRFQVSKKEAFFGLTSQSSSFLEEKQGTDCLQSNIWIRLPAAGSTKATVVELNYLYKLCLIPVFVAGPCRDSVRSSREGWAVFCTSSSLLWADTLSPRCTCWRTHSFFTRRSAQPFTAHTSHTEEVRWSCLGGGVPWCPDQSKQLRVSRSLTDWEYDC